MVAATYILLALGLLGALDIALYHSVSHGIRSHPDSRHELIVHSFRGPTYATLFIVVPNLGPGGAFFWALIALYAVDVAISIWDFAIERKSREFLGGLPSGEYVLHIFMAMCFGALVAATFFEGYHLAAEPSRLVYEPAAVPAIVRAAIAVLALAVRYSGAQDVLAVVRMRKEPRRADLPRAE